MEDEVFGGTGLLGCSLIWLVKKGWLLASGFLTTLLLRLNKVLSELGIEPSHGVLYIILPRWSDTPPFCLSLTSRLVLGSRADSKKLSMSENCCPVKEEEEEEGARARAGRTGRRR